MNSCSIQEMEKNINQKLKHVNRLTMRLSLVFTLSLLLLFFQLLPKRLSLPVKEIPIVKFTFVVEEIPMTFQPGHRMSQPARPTIPVESEEPDLPENISVDQNLTSFYNGFSSKGLGITAAKTDTIPPRPLIQTFPAYPKELQKNNVRGFVRLMLWITEDGKVEHAVIADNTTGNTFCADAAVEAARSSVYAPGLVNQIPAAMWVSCSYSFRPD